MSSGSNRLLWASFIIIACMVNQSSGTSFTPTAISVSPNYAKSLNSAYSFSFSAITAFNHDFEIRIFFPSTFSLVSPTGCSLLINSNAVSSALCSLSSQTNEIIFSSIGNTATVTTMEMHFNSSTGRYSGPFDLIIYLMDATTGTAITGETYYVTISIANAVMTCTLASTSTITGGDANFTIEYNPTVQIQANSIVQIQLAPWGPFYKSNFKTTNTTTICQGLCSVTAPSSNSNLYELVKYQTLYSSGASSDRKSLALNSARNPPSTKSVSFSVLVSANISSFSTKEYMTCTGSFSATTLNTFTSVNFATTNTAISQNNIVTLFLSLKNPISSLSYLRIDPSILSLSYQYNQYNNLPAKPNQFATTDSTFLLGNLTTSTTTSPSLIVLNNFTLQNPPYSTKPVSISFKTQNYIESEYYGIEEGTFNIVSTSSTIVSSGLTAINYDINFVTTYTIWFVIINKLISTSSIKVSFPSSIILSTSGTCSLTGISSICSISSTSQLLIDINAIVPASTNLTVTVTLVKNPPTTTTTSSLEVTTYYEDQSSIVDVLTSGLTITAKEVPLAGVSLSSSSYKVGDISNYTATVQISNALPASFHIEIILPTESFQINNLILRQIKVQKPGETIPVTYPSCILTTLADLHVKIPTSCFTSSLPALSQIFIMLGNITNPLSTKPTSSWMIRTYYNDKLMQYLNTGITITMTQTAQITNFAVTPENSTVNSQNVYTFEITFLYPHSSGSRLIIQLPTGIVLGSGYVCLPITSGISISCFQSSSQLIQVTFTTTTTITVFNSMKFSISKMMNNWFAGTKTLTVKTTINNPTYYYVESGTAVVNFVSGYLPATAASNEQIIALDNSKIQITLAPPFALSRVDDTSLLKMVIIVPNELLLMSGTCELLYANSVCTQSSQTLTLTNFGAFPSEMQLLFNATTTFFTSTSPFSIKLIYNNANIATNTVLKVLRYCIIPCKQCTATNSSQCLSCLPEPHTTSNILLPYNSTCVFSCPSTFYLQTSLNECAQCNATACLNCETTQNTCTSCQSDKVLFESKCQSTCPDQYYASNQQCLSCKSPCLTCTSATFCLNCINNYFLDIDNKCVLTCSLTGYIGIDGLCMECTNNCVTCQGTLTNCTSCQSPVYLLSNNECVRACDPGFYNNADSNCQPCVSPCVTCVTVSICQSCIADYFLYNGTTCTKVCPPGTLPKIITCQPCSEECATCENTITNCTSCTSSKLYYLNQCLDECPPLTYPYERTCTTCIVPCVTCSESPQVCLSCTEGLYLLNNTCLELCPTNEYYTDEKQKKCLPCLENCLICESTVACLSCAANYYLFDGVCVQQCPESKPIIEDRQCKSCSDECSKCEGKPTNCTQCTVFYFKYEYTCVEECPITYYSNIVNYQCQDALSTKIVFFPILITGLIVIFIALLSKIITTSTALPTTITCLLSPLQLSIWVYMIVLLGTPIKEPGVDYVLPIIMIVVALVCFFIAAFIFFKLNNKRVEEDAYCKQWATNSINYYTMKIISFVSLVFGAKFYRFVYSRFFNILSLSAAFKVRSNVFTLATVFTVVVLCFCQIPVIIGCWSLVYSKTLKDQIFYTSVQCLGLTIISIIISLIDIYKAEQFFDDTDFFKTKKYIEKVKDSSFNKLEEGFDINHDEGSVDAENYVGISGGKFMFTKKDPGSFNELYFENNEKQMEMEIENRSQETDYVDGLMTDKKTIDRSHMINIFAPIKEEEEEYYDQQKYQEGEAMTVVELQKKAKKVKTFESDEENDLDGVQQRKYQLGTDDPFDDKKSLISERGRKQRWNDIMTKRKELAHKIFNRHPISLQRIEDQREQEDFEQMMDQELNTIQKRRRKKKKKGNQNNKELEQIYLQRLTEKKKKLVKDVFFSDKALKYDF